MSLICRTTFIKIFAPRCNHYRPLSFTTALYNATNQSDDPPWTGDEDPKDAILRMLVDKYKLNTPLRVEGATRQNLPRPRPTIPPDLLTVTVEKQELNSKQKMAIKESRARVQLQDRIVNAKDKAFEYKIASSSSTTEAPPVSTREKPYQPRSLKEYTSLVEDRINSARARGEFDNLPGRGKPIALDPDASNPYLSRTEWLMNRIVRRQGALPAWIEFQQEIDTDVRNFRERLASEWRKEKETENDDLWQKKREWCEEKEKYTKVWVEKVNSRIRSYNILAPSVARKGLLTVDGELKRIMDENKQCIN